MNKAIAIRVKGLVQGVGFRPFVYKLAKKHNLKGFVLNDDEGVKIEVAGLSGNITRFLNEIQKSPPPLSEIISLKSNSIKATDFQDFSILESRSSKDTDTLISPDISTCTECLDDITDADNRRYLYPFTNCTNCGPRYTIIQKIPYDRPNTTMCKFKMCRDCASEYSDPLNRRFHAQPIACPVCGPKLKLLDKNGRPLKSKNPLSMVIKHLKKGKIVAIKGIGGFHLACDAANNTAVTRLRSNKGREEKPLAVMVFDNKSAQKIAKLSSSEKKLLLMPEKPIVLLNKKTKHGLAAEVSPNNDYFGVMLPYTPLHHLLFSYEPNKKAIRRSRANFRALVMTSANISEEPIVINDTEAKTMLSGVFDYVLTNNRDIHTRADDSVVRKEGENTVFIRRSRGFAPAPVFSKMGFKEILGVGAELKNTICYTRGNNAFLSQHIGDLKNVESFEFFKRTVKDLSHTIKIDPDIIAFDLHPGYMNTKWVMKQDYDTKIGVQHHHAHMASCMIENNLSSQTIGIILDGTGYGIDSTIWGGEILVGDLGSFERAAHLRKVAMPGGDAAASEPFRMAFSYLYATYGKYWEDLDLKIDFISRVGWERLKFFERMIESKTNSPMTSSLGRFFDAVSSLTGVRDNNTYEGQAAMELEMSIRSRTKETYPYTRYRENDMYVINTLPIVEHIVEDLRKNKNRTIAAKFHNTMIKAFAGAAHRVSKDTGIKKVVLSGGCFQNMYLLKGMIDRLKMKGLTPFVHRNIPPNDGGIALGQAAIANRITYTRK